MRVHTCIFLACFAVASNRLVFRMYLHVRVVRDSRARTRVETVKRSTPDPSPVGYGLPIRPETWDQCSRPPKKENDMTT